MMLLSTPPAPNESGLNDYYRRCAEEGSVFSGMIENQSYQVSESFDPAWSVAALCWCAGGTETYEFQDGRTIDLKAGSVLAIGENERYAYASHGSRPFKSAMIVFPRAMTQSLASVSESATQSQTIRTGLFKPDENLRNDLHAFSRVAQNRDATAETLEEQAALVAAGLINLQQADASRSNRLKNVKQGTRDALCNRLRRAVAMMHDLYGDSSLDLETLSREACIARHHFVRVFTSAYGVTPLRYLGELRMQAAARLLESMDMSASEVAIAVGFSNRSAFQRKFRQFFGITPASWKNQGH